MRKVKDGTIEWDGWILSLHLWNLGLIQRECETVLLSKDWENRIHRWWYGTII